MNNPQRLKLRNFIAELLSNRDDTGNVADAELLFASGRLDSLAAVEVITFLEQEFGVDFGEMDFSIEDIGSIDSIATLVGNRSA
jgi:acyl carrier protein